MPVLPQRPLPGVSFLRRNLRQYGFGLYWMMPASGFVAGAAVILSVLTLARDWSQLCLHDLAILFIAAR
jgi:hypothetical protein